MIRGCPENSIPIVRRLHPPACFIGSLLALYLLLGAGDLIAQLSPGDLSQPHAQLEGNGQCMECHERREGVSADRCLACHQILGQRIDAGEGLHSRPDYEPCERCHIEHHGRDFELIWWGDEGRATFDHRLTGYALEGAHTRLECSTCHHVELVKRPAQLRAQGKDLSRTYLGLSQETCLSCHRDEHEGQFAVGSCRDCHSMSVWSPVVGFDHRKTDYPLTGRHSTVPCTDCHRPLGGEVVEEGDPSLKFVGLAFGQCADCHRDPHQSRLGASCDRCHSTDSWDQYRRSEFDHDRTRYPLLGAHRRVACARCHPAGRSFRVARFGVCSDCHSDTHLGQFANRPDGIACEGCHSLDSFSPATFPLAAHQQTAFPLEGGHLAVACNGCHQAVPPSEIARVFGRPARPVRSSASRAGTIQFRYSSTRCLDCHQDPHRSEVDRFVNASGCPACHTVESWHQSVFDHKLSSFSLEGRHQTVACLACHPRIDQGTAGERIQLKGLATTCAGCHQDPHLGQFSRQTGRVACRSCHTLEGWRLLAFDHEQNSIFKLTGAHARVACGECHKTEIIGTQPVVRYKPLPTACEKCHSGSVPR